MLSAKSFAQCWQNISPGGPDFSHILAVKNDGTLWAWGSNDYVKCHNSFQNYTTIPTQVGSENDWLQASAASYHSMAIKNNGDLYGWGANYYGNIGIGTSGNTSFLFVNSLTHIGNSTWTSVVCGYDFTIAINSNGSLWGWGENFSGQLGGESTGFKTIPTQIGTSNDWQQITTVYHKAYGIKLDGTLWTWGINFLTQIGSDNWTEINGGYGIKSDGTLWQLSSPLVQIGVDSDWISVSQGFVGDHRLALKSDGTLWAWGGNYYGQLGDGTNVDKENPIQIGTNSNWTSIYAGGRFSLALNSNGELWSWGSNEYGQLGDGSFIHKNVPTLISCPSLEIAEIKPNLDLKLYPNPTSNLIFIDFPNKNSIDTICILNQLGQTIIEVNEYATGINVEKLQAGIYFVQISSEQGVYSTKFIKN